MALVKGALAVSWVIFRSAPIQARHPGSGCKKRLEEEVTGTQTSSDRIDKDERIQPVRPDQILGVGHAVERVVTYHYRACVRWAETWQSSTARRRTIDCLDAALEHRRMADELGVPQKFLEENSPDHLMGQCAASNKLTALTSLPPSFFCSSVIPPTFFSTSLLFF